MINSMNRFIAGDEFNCIDSHARSPTCNLTNAAA